MRYTPMAELLGGDQDLNLPSSVQKGVEMALCICQNP